MSELKVVGIDPSLAATGIAFASEETAVVRDRKLKGDKRLVLLYLAVKSAVRGVDFAVIEDLPTHAKSAGLTGRAQGVVRLALQHEEVPYIALPPATLKKAATGKGNADKKAMREAMESLLGERPGMSHDEVDAWWLRECGLFLAGDPVNFVHADGEEGLGKYQPQVEELLSGRGG